MSTSTSNNASDISGIESELDKTDNKSMVPAQESGQPLLRLVHNLQDKFKSLPAVINSSSKLPATFDFDTMPNVSQILADRFTRTYSVESYEKSVRELSIVTLGIVGFIVVSFIGWKVSREINFINGGNFIYNTGLIGGILMLLTLLYSIIKRNGFLSRRLSSSHSYYAHIIFGGTGALLIMIHSSFDFRSINSNVAMISMLLIVISGAFGRYLYTQFSLMLHQLYLKVKDSEPGLYKRISYYNCNTANQITLNLSNFTSKSFNKPKNVVSFIILNFSIFYYAIRTYIVTTREIYRIVESASILGDLDKKDARQIKKTHKMQIRSYIFDITKMGYLSLLEQLFMHWRVLHVPFLYILFLTAIAHVVVVHMY